MPALSALTTSDRPKSFPQFLSARPRPHDGGRGQDRPAIDAPPGLGELELVLDRPAEIMWQYMAPRGRPSFTAGLLSDMRFAMNWLERAYDPDQPPFRYLVLASRLRGAFNLGGDLPFFIRCIRARNRAVLRRYAHACIDVQHLRATKLRLPYISVSLVQGDALGGGFEAALADDIIIAERSARFGLPEILFNLFPGMGAYSFLSRRLGPVQAERMMLSGSIYGAEELHALGLVDAVANDGEGEDAVRRYIASTARSRHARMAMHDARRIANPVTREELIGITDLWVDAALALSEKDVRRMEHLAAAQDRRTAAA